MSGNVQKCAYCSNPAHANAALEPVSPARAEEIWRARGRMVEGSKLTLTAGECAYIKQLWERLPGEYTYSNTLSRIMEGGTLEAPHARVKRARASGRAKGSAT